MADAWGGAFGAAWGSSWGTGEEPPPTPPTRRRDGSAVEYSGHPRIERRQVYDTRPEKRRRLAMLLLMGMN